ncbi:hypothetical protein Rhopal_001965-T1 [Rhodotorula paludigena]|uniref:Protein kinase domain-containing protein n=1 Tax=Rhodotorula paludigena TaxID=86838 RepID=A0AAV5GGK6_9BASI|nr:hypothetical protein Rhopal_001965-T1 [Rhodotorula paludigena]
MMGYMETAGPADAHDIWAVGVLVVNYASLDPEAPWPRYYYRDGDGKGLREWGNKHFPFDVPGVERLPSIRERVQATRALGNDSEVEGVSSFLRACWTIDPEARPTAAQLLQHEWLQGVV